VPPGRRSQPGSRRRGGHQWQSMTRHGRRRRWPRQQPAEVAEVAHGVAKRRRGRPARSASLPAGAAAAAVRLVRLRLLPVESPAVVMDSDLWLVASHLELPLGGGGAGGADQEAWLMPFLQNVRVSEHDTFAPMRLPPPTTTTPPPQQLAFDVSPWAADQEAWLMPFLQNVRVGEGRGGVAGGQRAGRGRFGGWRRAARGTPRCGLQRRAGGTDAAAAAAGRAGRAGRAGPPRRPARWRRRLALRAPAATLPGLGSPLDERHAEHWPGRGRRAAPRVAASASGLAHGPAPICGPRARPAAAAVARAPADALAGRLHRERPRPHGNALMDARVQLARLR